MMKSMTGFGRCEVSEGQRKFTVELKGDEPQILRCQYPYAEEIEFFDASIRSLLKQYAQRGKVDIFITYEDMSENQAALKYNAALAEEYLQYFKQMEEAFSLENDIRVSTLSRCPEVLTMEEQPENEEELWNGLKKALEGAFTQFVETRIVEGENLKKDINVKLDELLALVEAIEERSPEIISEYRAKLELKVKELLEDVQMDENRLAAEVILFADKICTDEETVRLRSHIEHMRNTLEAGEGIGRKLDFIAQEMNREANTILSKANDIEVSNHAIDLKTGIEKIREQIQNIE